jgi:hypothetical protein
MIGIWRLVVGATLAGCCVIVWVLPDLAQAGIGSCSTEEVRGLREEGFSAKEIRELCKKESEGESSGRSGSRSYDFDQRTNPPRIPFAARCGCYAGPMCPLVSPLPQAAPCFCMTPYGSCQGQAY